MQTIALSRMCTLYLWMYVIFCKINFLYGFYMYTHNFSLNLFCFFFDKFWFEHLDVGFTNTSTIVVNEYFDDYFPLAIKTAEQSKELGLSFIYTTHAFLVSLYLDCPKYMNLHCPNQTSINAFLKALKNGIIFTYFYYAISHVKFEKKHKNKKYKDNPINTNQ